MTVAEIRAMSAPELAGWFAHFHLSAREAAKRAEEAKRKAKRGH